MTRTKTTTITIHGTPAIITSDANTGTIEVHTSTGQFLGDIIVDRRYGGCTAYAPAGNGWHYQMDCDTIREAVDALLHAE